MIIFSYISGGFEGDMVKVEVDLRRGIPGMDIVGLPDSAVRESRERVRAALRNSGFHVPRERILINLAPAGVKKVGAAFDLPIAAALLLADGQLYEIPSKSLLLMGELELSGAIRPVHGVLAAVVSAMKGDVDFCIVPDENREEAQTVGGNRIISVNHLSELKQIFSLLLHGKQEVLLDERTRKPKGKSRVFSTLSDFADMSGQEHLKRACEIATAGRHHLLIFGPPGVGKSMAALRCAGILPDLRKEESVELTRIYSIGGQLPGDCGLIRRPPLRSPHHTASREGVIGGGPRVLPGEISYAHWGILFLDEVMEYSTSLLQSLREPLEKGTVEIARSGRHFWYPARFQLIMAANPCPCGKLGQPEAACMCSPLEIHRYWKKLGAALLDRIDLRIPVEIQGPSLTGGIGPGETCYTSAAMAERVKAAIEIQMDRFGLISKRNAEMNTSDLRQYCGLNKRCAGELRREVKNLSLSTRAEYSVLRISRTVADLEGSTNISLDHLLEAFQYRRFADGDYFWNAA